MIGYILLDDNIWYWIALLIFTNLCSLFMGSSKSYFGNLFTDIRHRKEEKERIKKELVKLEKLWPQAMEYLRKCVKEEKCNKVYSCPVFLGVWDDKDYKEKKLMILLSSILK